MSIFVDVQTLNKKINHHPYKIIDVRQSASLYEESHIPHAIYLDPIKYISGQKSFFVDPPILGEKLSAVGINEKTEIVIYDDGTNRNAAKRSEEHTSELQSRGHLVCRLLLEKKKKQQ